MTATVAELRLSLLFSLRSHRKKHGEQSPTLEDELLPVNRNDMMLAISNLSQKYGFDRNIVYQRATDRHWISRCQLPRLRTEQTFLTQGFTPYPPYTLQDLDIDATRETTAAEQTTHFAQGPAWQGDPVTCYLDTSIMLARVLDVGRVRCDQMTAEESLKLDALPSELRAATNKWWGLMSVENINRTRDVLLQFVEHKLGKPRDPSGYRNMLEVLLPMLKGVAQTSFNTAEVLECRSCGDWGVEASHVRDRQAITLDTRATDAGTLNEKINKCFELLYPEKIVDKCKRNGCNGTRGQRKIVLDRLPRRLVLGDNFETKIGCHEGLWDDLHVRWIGRDKTMHTTKYRVCMVVHYGMMHYWLSARREGKWWVYDGMHPAQFPGQVRMVSEDSVRAQTKSFGVATAVYEALA